MSAPTDEVDDLHNVTVVQIQLGIRVPVAKDRAIVLNDDEARIDIERAEEARDGAVTLKLPRRSVHHQGDRRGRFRSLNHRLKYSA